VENSNFSLRYPLAIDSALGQCARELSHAEHVKQLAKQVLYCAPGSRINRPDFGCGLRQMIFSPLCEVTESLTRITVLQALDRWLGDLIAVEEVQVKTGEETLEIGVVYRLRARNARQFLNVEVTL
jgi:uncharacterized protein